MEKYFFIGDVHACYDETIELLNKNDGRTIVFLGDCFDRGPFGLKMIDLVYEMVIEKKIAKYIPGNHCNKFYRWCKGQQVRLSGGIVTIVNELNQLSDAEKKAYINKFIKLYETASKYLILDHGKIVAVHAGWKDNVINTLDQKEIEAVCLYNNVINEKGSDGFPIEWVDKYIGNRIIVRGHIVYSDQSYIINNVYSIDTGCVHGGNLTGLMYPEMTVLQVKAKKAYHGGH